MFLNLLHISVLLVSIVGRVNEWKPCVRWSEHAGSDVLIDSLLIVVGIKTGVKSTFILGWIKDDPD